MFRRKQKDFFIRYVAIDEMTDSSLHVIVKSVAKRKWSETQTSAGKVKEPAFCADFVCVLVILKSNKDTNDQ